MSKTYSDTWVVIPAYNEGESICQPLSDLASFPFRVVVVDDGSRDDTGAQALRYPVVLLSHVANLGQGAALQTGIEYALSFPETKYIITFDADGQHHAADIPRLVEKLQQGYDVALGSRFLAGGSAVGITPSKKVTLFLAILFTRWSLGMRLTDTHNGLRAFTAESARRLRITQNGMAHASEILNFIQANRLRYCEVPVTVSYTEYSKAKGQSIFNGINILWDLFVEKLR